MLAASSGRGAERPCFDPQLFEWVGLAA